MIVGSNNAFGAASNGAAPIWALTPTRDADELTGFDLLVSNGTTQNYGSYASVSGWYQVWGAPTRCYDTPPCTNIIALAYMEFSTALPQATLDIMKSTYGSLGGYDLQDITTEVPNAALAIIFNISNSWAGYVIFNTRKHMISLVKTSMPVISSSGDGGKTPIELSATVETDMKTLMKASGTAAGA